MSNKLYNKIDRDIDSIIEARFFHYDDNDTWFSHEFLCHTFNLSKYEKLWEHYWDKFNTENKIFVTDYITDNHDDSIIISALTRLLIAEDFKLYCYHEMKKRK